MGCGLGGAEILQRSYRTYFERHSRRVRPTTVPLIMASGPASQVCMRFGIRGPAQTYSIACASSSVAIGEAFRSIRDGHSDVVIAGGAAISHIKGVVCLSSQTYGSDLVGQLSPRPLLLVHGKSDTRLPFSCSQQIYDRALEPKQLVLYDGAEHRLEECRDDLELLLSDWIPATLAAPASTE